MLLAVTKLTVQILRFVDEAFPGWVECRFVDATGRQHSFIEKVPIVTNEDLDADSAYPQPGIVGCEIVRQYQDDKGQRLAPITTSRPWSIETAEGLSEFTVSADLINV
jgi:hypothetical protein